MYETESQEEPTDFSSKNPPDGNTNRLLIKFGGNAMKNPAIQQNVLENICHLRRSGYDVVLVHGGGPAISETLEMAGIKSEFIGGHRKTDTNAMRYVEMALKGRVNGELVRIINGMGVRAVGISGKDGGMILAKMRIHKEVEEGKITEKDLGRVGDVKNINPKLVEILLKSGYVPVIAPIAIGPDGDDVNINADMFAGHLAGALEAGRYIVLTDVDGLLRDKDDPSTLIHQFSVNDVKKEMGGIIKGGMIPKCDACIVAVESGVEKAEIANGTTRDILLKLISGEVKGTIIKK